MTVKLLVPVCLLVLCMNSSFVEKTSSAILHVEISNVSSTKGKLYVGIFRRKDKFPEITGKFKGFLVDPKTSVTSYTISDLPPDTYAVAVFHDKNKNNILDKNMLGVPTEEYGFSNNARRTFSAPSFDEAAFELKSERKIKLEIK